MKKFNKFLSLMLVLAMVLSLVACGGSSAPAATEAPAAATEAAVAYVDPFADVADDYDELSQAVYDEVLGEFYTYYMEAMEETSTAA